MTHDRVLRFLPHFETAEQAARYATEQAMAWISRPAHARDPATSTRE